MICLKALAGDGDEATDQVLPLATAGDRCAVWMRALPGAARVHLLFSRAGQPTLRAEVPAQGNEMFWLYLKLDPGGALQIDSPGRPPLLLPLTPALPPAAPIDLAGRTDIDLAIVVDGTCRVPAPAGIAPPAAAPLLLLADREQWAAHVDKLCRFAAALGCPQNCRAAVLAFGDQPVANITAADLTPHYRLYPADRDRGTSASRDPWMLSALSPEQIRNCLLDLPATSGGDFVDALADALDACCRLNWRPQARKLILVTGDSPGHSLLHPVPKGGDASIREHDVDTGILRLQRLGVERVMIYQHDQDAIEAPGLLDAQRDFLRFADAQYHRLASLPEWAFTAAEFEGTTEAEAWRRHTGFIAGDSAFGEILEIASLPVLEAPPNTTYSRNDGRTPNSGRDRISGRAESA